MISSISFFPAFWVPC